MKCKRRLCFKRNSEECYNLHMEQNTYNCPVKGSILHVVISMIVGLIILPIGCWLEYNKVIICIGVALILLGFILGFIWSPCEDFYNED